MNKEMPMIPRMKVPLVDVRDVAKAHISSIENNHSIGNRFLLCENTYWMKDISLKMKKMGYNSPTIVAPDFVIKFFWHMMVIKQENLQQFDQDTYFYVLA